MASENESSRAGASSAPEGVEPPKEDLRDLFLDENKLVRLAMGQLGGRNPKTAMRRPRRQKVETGQPAHLRRALAEKLKRELTARGWSSVELAEQTALSQAECRAMFTASMSFTEEAVKELAKVFATSQEYWKTDLD